MVGVRSLESELIHGLQKKCHPYDILGLKCTAVALTHAKRTQVTRSQHLPKCGRKDGSGGKDCRTLSDMATPRFLSSLLLHKQLRRGGDPKAH